MCRWQNKFDRKFKICFGEGRKHCGKMEKMLVSSIFSISHNFSKKLLSQGWWILGLCGKSNSSVAGFLKAKTVDVHPHGNLTRENTL